jgi:hypothetical protein
MWLRCAAQRRRISLHYPIRKRSILYPNVSSGDCFSDLLGGHWQLSSFL